MLNELSSLFVGKNKKINSSKSPLIFALLGFTFIFVVMFIYTFMFASTCHEANYDQAILSFGITIGSLFCIISTITRSYGILFQSKDFDF